MKEKEEMGQGIVIPTSKVKMADLPDAMKSLIKETIRENIWRFCKFVPTKDESEMRVGGKIFDALKPKLPTLQKLNNHQKRAWVRAHLLVFGCMINSTRSYAVSEMKKAAMKYYHAHGNTLPSVDDFIACAQRKIDVTKEDAVKVYEFYWDEILPRACANMTDWGKDKRHYATISEAAPLDNPNKVFVPPSTEAFCVLMYHNHRDSWVEMAKVSAEVGGGRKLSHGKKNGGNDGEPYVITPKCVRLYADKYKPLWSDSEGGSSRTGGFTKAGLKKFQEYVDMVKAARELPESLEVEKKFLEVLRKKYDITCQTIEEEKAKKKRKRASEDDEDDEEDYIDLEFSDDEDDGMDYGDDDE